MTIQILVFWFQEIDLYKTMPMHKELRVSVRLRSFTWDIENTTLKIVYRSGDEITFYNLSEETVETFLKAINKSRFINVLKRNPAIPHNVAKKRLSE